VGKQRPQYSPPHNPLCNLKNIVVSMDTAAKAKIVRQASALFFQFGPSKVTMEEIASQLAMSKKTLYKHFDSKEVLLEAVVEDFQCSMHCTVQPILEAAYNANEEEFTAILGKLGEDLAILISRSASSPMFGDIQRNYPEVWQMLEERRRENITKSLSTVLEQGVQRGIFRHEVNFEVFLRLYINALEYIMNPNVLAALPITAADAYKMLLNIFFVGMFSDKGRAIAATHIHQTLPLLQGHANGTHANGKELDEYEGLVALM